MGTSRECSITISQIALGTSSAVASYFLISDAGEYLRHFTPAVYGRFWSVRDLMFAHIATGALALVVGAVQMYLGLRRQTSTAHRWLGRVYVSAVLVSCIASLLVLRRGSVVGPAWVALLATLSIAALVFTVLGWNAARHRERHRHSAWMLRSYMAMMVFAWFRLLWEIPVLLDAPAGIRAPVLLGIAMFVSLAAAELVLKLRADPSRTPMLTRTSEGARP